MNPLRLTLTSKLNFQLNDTELSQEDFCLLLEVIGYDVPANLSVVDIFKMSLCSLPLLEEDEFYYIFTRFTKSNPSERVFMRQVVAQQKHSTVYSSPN